MTRTEQALEKLTDIQKVHLYVHRKQLNNLQMYSVEWAIELGKIRGYIEGLRDCDILTDIDCRLVKLYFTQEAQK